MHPHALHELLHSIRPPAGAARRSHAAYRTMRYDTHVRRIARTAYARRRRRA
eukprot:SAG25_NODE_4175_length_872_cov_0.849935_1_plen_51_part_10